MIQAAPNKSTALIADEVEFQSAVRNKALAQGETWEINNTTLHAVDNHSDQDRIHLIVGWVPNSTVRPEDKRAPVAAPKQSAESAIPRYNERTVGRNQPCSCNSGKNSSRTTGRRTDF